MYYQPSEGYAITLRLKLANKPGVLGQVTSAIGQAGWCGLRLMRKLTSESI